jgi:hypothetical protein
MNLNTIRTRKGYNISLQTKILKKKILDKERLKMIYNYKEDEYDDE